MNVESPDLSLSLTHSTYQIWIGPRLVSTLFPDSLKSDACRDDTPQNIEEARAQGYLDCSDEEAVWSSLVDHEILHSIAADIVFNRPSCVLRTEAGGGYTPTWQRYEEETLILSLQSFFNAHEMSVRGESNPQLLCPPPLYYYSEDKIIKVIHAWRFVYEPALEIAKRIN